MMWRNISDLRVNNPSLPTLSKLLLKNIKRVMSVISHCQPTKHMHRMTIFFTDNFCIEGQSIRSNVYRGRACVFHKGTDNRSRQPCQKQVFLGISNDTKTSILIEQLNNPSSLTVQLKTKWADLIDWWNSKSHWHIYDIYESKTGLCK